MIWVNITLPSYTGCTFTLVYKYYICDIGGFLTDYTMGDFQILSHNCPAFSTALNNAYTNGTSAFNTFADNFENSIYNALETAIIQTYVPPGTYPCFGGVFFNIRYSKASCFKYCLIEFANQTASLVKVICGVDCCQRHTRVCRNSNGLVIESYYVAPDNRFCLDPPDFSENEILKYRCTRTTSCRYVCPEI